MTTAVFSMQNGKPCGVYVQGHSGFAEEGNDIVCAAVSSAVYFVANQLVDDPMVKANCSEARFSLYRDGGHPLLDGLLAHLKDIASQYPRNLRVCYLNLNGGK